MNSVLKFEYDCIDTIYYMRLSLKTLETFKRHLDLFLTWLKEIKLRFYIFYLTILALKIIDLNIYADT